MSAVPALSIPTDDRDGSAGPRAQDTVQAYAHDGGSPYIGCRVCGACVHDHSIVRQPDSGLADALMTMILLYAGHDDGRIRAGQRP